MAKKDKKTIPEDKPELYQRLVRRIPNLEIKSNFGFPYTPHNEHMFSLLTKNGFVGIRLPQDQREAFLEKYDNCLYQLEHGRFLKEYVTVPDNLLKDNTDLTTYLESGLNYTKTLKSKPTKRK